MRDTENVIKKIEALKYDKNQCFKQCSDKTIDKVIEIIKQDEANDTCFSHGNKDDITEAVHGLDIFTKNYCMNVALTNQKGEPMFRCSPGCPFLLNSDGVCAIKMFVNNNEHNYPMDNFGSMGSH